MTDLNAVLDTIPIGDIAKRLGIPEDVAESAVKQVLPGLVGGLAANASDSAGSASLEKALGKHVGASTKVDDIDTADGAKIVKNIFGSNRDAVAGKLAAAEPKPNVTADIIKQILPIVAPIVLSFLASQLFAPKSSPASTSTSTSATPAAKSASRSAPASGSGGLDIGGLLGSLLSDPKAQSVVGGLLGGLLGGGKK